MSADICPILRLIEMIFFVFTHSNARKLSFIKLDLHLYFYLLFDENARAALGLGRTHQALDLSV